MLEEIWENATRNHGEWFLKLDGEIDDGFSGLVRVHADDDGTIFEQVPILARKFRLDLFAKPGISIRRVCFQSLRLGL